MTSAYTPPLQTPSMRAKNLIVVLCIGGVAASIVGVWVAVAQHPSTTRGAFGAVHETGSTAGYGFGLVILGLGSALMFIAVTAWGVMLGLQAARMD